MTTRTDPLVAPSRQGPDRLNFEAGMLLDASSFSAEQTYHRARLARGLQYLFGPGTVAGLDIAWREASQEIVVTPGLALDPLGRLIEIPQHRCIRIREWFAAQRPEDLQSAWIDEFGPAVLIADIFVRFRVTAQGKTPAFADGPFDATNAVADARLRDDFELGLVVREEAGARRAAIAAGSPNPPQIPVPDDLEILLGIPPGDVAAVQARILELWRDQASDWSRGSPPRLREHLAPRVQFFADDQTQIGRDSTALMLARLAIPVQPPAAADAPPLDLGQPPMFDESAPTAQYRSGKFTRRFVYALGHLTQPAVRGDGP